MILLEDSAWPDLLVLALVLWSSAYVLAARRFTFWTKRGVPYEPPRAFFGNLLPVLLSRVGVGGLLEDLYRRHEGRPLVGLFAFHRPLLLVRDPEVLRKVLVQDFAAFHDRSVSLDPELDPLGAKNLFGTSGQRWRALRTKLTPTFTSGKLKRMFGLMDAIGAKLAAVVDAQLAPAGGVVDVRDVSARYTLDVIASCVLGLPAEALEDPASPLATYVRAANAFDAVKAAKFALALFAPALMTALRLRLEDARLGAYLRGVVHGHAARREESGVVRGDFLDLLLQLRRAGDVEMDGDDLVAQCAIFLIAGYDTSANTMAFALYELALDQEVQGRLRAELLQQVSSEGLTYDAVSRLSYLNMVVSETLRKYPPIPVLNRVATEDCELLPGVTVPAGTNLVVSVSGLHGDPRYHPDPRRFDPERFSDGNRALLAPYSYLPFGEGPRACIGARMGLMQTKLGLAHLLSRYSVEACGDTPSPLRLDRSALVLTPEGQVPLLLRRLTDS